MSNVADQLLAALAKYPIDEDGDSFIDTFADCVRYNEVDNLLALIGFLLQNHPDLQSEFAAFGVLAKSGIETLDQYYAEYAETVREFEVQHPTPSFEVVEGAQAEEEENDDTTDTEEPPKPVEHCPDPNPPAIPHVPELSAPLKTLIRQVAITPSKQGFTPIHAACANNHLPLLSLLFLDALVLPDDFNNTVSMNEDGGSPVHWACLNGHVEIVKLLVKFGANVSKRNLEGKSALGLAEMMGRERVVNWIVLNCDVGLDDDSSMAEAMASKGGVSSP
ncbi:UNVERIFIED_CONTAM: hypothetical protein HDU68_010612 [Siphonaria sp. JEL0065]|nr:hypothetical protein HDU68_010612 [Siphonaria sp. JEL0065]